MLNHFRLGLVAATMATLLAACGASAPQPAPEASTADTDAPAAPIEAEAPSKSETRAQRDQRLREQAKTDPKRADDEAIAGMNRNEVLATAINTAGFLCARVTEMYLSGGNIIAHCVEYRNGSGRVKYRVNANAGTVEQL